MNILAFDTATPVTSVAVVADGKTLSEISITGDKAQMERLMPMIDAALEEAGVRLSQINGIAVGTGPGLFTSLRIGVVTANTLSQTLHVPVAGVSSLDALAHAVSGRNGIIAAAIDARRGEVFTVTYKASGGGIKAITSVRAVKPDELADKLAGQLDTLTLVGSGFATFDTIFKDAMGIRFQTVSPELMFPRASSIAMLAAATLAQKPAHEACLVAPIYVRNPDADEHIKKMKK
jgi:tRNA threonylcarbamoyladenosine biosynthesis protein TsaB